MNTSNDVIYIYIEKKGVVFQLRTSEALVEGSYQHGYSYIIF